jgi:hypothetical protein
MHPLMQSTSTVLQASLHHHYTRLRNNSPLSILTRVPTCDVPPLRITPNTMGAVLTSLRHRSAPGLTARHLTIALPLYAQPMSATTWMGKSDPIEFFPILSDPIEFYPIFRFPAEFEGSPV